MPDLPPLFGSRTLTGVVIIISLFLVVVLGAVVAVLISPGTQEFALDVIDTTYQLCQWLAGGHFAREAVRTVKGGEDASKAAPVVPAVASPPVEPAVGGD